MKRAKIVFGIAFLLCFWALSTKAAQTDFSGTWVLDKESVKGLPANLGSYTIIVRQDAQQLVVDTQMEAKQNKGEAAQKGNVSNDGIKTQGGAKTVAGGGMVGMAPGTSGPPTSDTSIPGRRALLTAAPEATYSLDGKKTNDHVPGIGDVTFKAKWAKDGKSLELWMVHSVVVDQMNVDTTSKERWTLSEDGQVLKLQRTVSSAQGSDTINLRFLKKQSAQ